MATLYDICSTCEGDKPTKEHLEMRERLRAAYPGIEFPRDRFSTAANPTITFRFPNMVEDMRVRYYQRDGMDEIESIEFAIRDVIARARRGEYAEYGLKL